MKKLKLILLIQALILGVLTLNAEDCPCEGGTAPYSVDCDGDGTNDACSTDDCPAPAVSITSGGGDVREGCSVTWDCSPSGGSGNYTYSWSFSTGNLTGTTQSLGATAAVLGAGNATVTVTDTVSSKTATASQGYHVRKQVEATQTSSQTTYPNGETFTAVSGQSVCPGDSPKPCSISFETNSSMSLEIGFTASAGGGIPGLVSAEVSGTTTTTLTSSTGVTYTYSLSAGQTGYVGGRPISTRRTGNWTEYDCSGIKQSGTWEDVGPRGTGFEYTLVTVN